jgi:hypothetical protein
MSNDALSAETVAVLHKELKEQQAKIEAAEAWIAKIEALLEASATVERAPLKKVKAPPELANLDTGDACIWLLKPKGNGARMTTREIADGLAAVGYKKKTTNQITVALHHRRKNKADIKRDGLYWVYVNEAPAAKPAPSPAPVTGAQPQQPIKPAAAPQAAPTPPQKGTPSSTNGVAASGLR